MKRFMEDATIMVTGASGMIGSRIVSVLLTEETNVIVITLVRNRKKLEKKIGELINSSRLVILEQDICEPVQYEGRIDYIIHTASVTGGSKQHIDTPMTTIQTALKGTIQMLELAREKQVKGMVYTSSLEIYGTGSVINGKVNEKMGSFIEPTNVRNSYSESKRMCETICASYAKQFLVPVKIARLTATFGPGVEYRDGRVFAQFARAIIEKKDIILKSTGETVRNYCDVDDCVNAILLLLTNGVSGEAYNVANEDTEISIRDLGERFIQLYSDVDISLKFDLSEDATKFGYNQTMRLVLDSKKLQDLGWYPKYSLEETIRRLVDFMKCDRNYV